METAGQAKELRTIPLGSLLISKTNPRKGFDKAGLEELAQSLKSSGGAIAPLLVRRAAGWESTEKFEIIAGERRFKAAKLAGLTDLACLVQEVTDEQAMEMQLIENLQREDLSPIEEGQGYRTLMEKTGQTAEQVGEKVGKSRRYVYARMKLCDLVPAAAKLLAEGILTASHADWLGRLQPEDQEAMLKHTVQEGFDGVKRVAPVRDLELIIKQEVYRDLKSVAFPKDDTELVKSAGACTACPKNTDVNPEAATKAKPGTCTDGGCFQAKIEAYAQGQTAEAKKDGKPLLRLSTGYPNPTKGQDWIPQDAWRRAKAGSCPHTAEGIVVEGREDDSDGGKLHRGELMTVCAERKCNKHWADRQHETSNDGSSWRKRQAAQRKKLELEKRARLLLWQRYYQAAPKALGWRELQFLATTLYERVGEDTRRVMGQALGWEPVKGRYGTKDWEKTAGEKLKTMLAAELARFLMGCAVAGGMLVNEYSQGGCTRLFTEAKRLKLDIAKVRREVSAEKKAKKGKKKVLASARKSGSQLPVASSQKKANRKRPPILVKGALVEKPVGKSQKAGKKR